MVKRIIVTAGGDIQVKLIAQLEPSSTMFIMVNDQYENQQRTLLERDYQGVLKQSKVLPVSF